jgi:hypothetical protein
MTLRACARQSEVQQLLARGHWPHACPEDLRAHVGVCRTCADLVLVAQVFQRDRANTAAMAQLPAPGAIWWRAQLRRRNAAVERVGKPILGAYVFALLFMVLAGAVVVVSQAWHGVRWMDWLGQAQMADVHLQSFNPLTVLNPGWSLPVLIPVIATVAMLGAVVVYLAANRNDHGA